MLQHQGAESSFLCLPLWSALTSFMISIADNLHMITMFTKKVYLCLRFGQKVGRSGRVLLGWVWSPSLLHPWSRTSLATHLSSGKLAIVAFLSKYQYNNIATSQVVIHNLSSGKLASSFLSKYWRFSGAKKYYNLHRTF